ncbi:MAG TPA: protein kinase, partial [Chloroflexota bacterium]|nr:protein kinase [Chloroflexota bacterium]
MEGQTLNGIYRVLELVGAGGFADVYIGRDLRSNTVVAVKVLHEHFARDPNVVRRFLREAQVAQSMADPHAVRVLDAGQDGAGHYIIMEYVQGLTLAQIIQNRGQLPIQEAVDYTQQVLQALSEAHEHGIVHRDIKPHNLMVTAAGFLKVMDFGIAKDVTAGTLTQSAVYVGTPRYMSPEQARGEKADARSDLYAVSVTLYEMLAGQPPFSGETPWKVLNLQMTAEPPPLETVRNDVPPALLQVLATGLSKDPDRRYQNADDMIHALGAALSGADSSGTIIAGLDQTIVQSPAPPPSAPSIVPLSKSASGLESSHVRDSIPVSSVGSNSVNSAPSTGVLVNPTPGPRRPWLIGVAGICAVAIVAVGVFALTRSTSPTGAAVIPTGRS